MRGFQRAVGVLKDRLHHNRLYSFSSAAPQPVMSSPGTGLLPRLGAPAAGSSGPVVLPQPLSPSQRKVSPSPMEKLTPSTAWMASAFRPSQASAARKCLTSPLLSSSRSATSAPRLRQPAMHESCPPGKFSADTPPCTCPSLRGSAAERDKPWGMFPGRGAGLDLVEPVPLWSPIPAPSQQRRCRDVGVPCESAALAGAFHDPPRVHDVDPVAQSGDDSRSWVTQIHAGRRFPAADPRISPRNWAWMVTSREVVGSSAISIPARSFSPMAAPPAAACRR